MRSHFFDLQLIRDRLWDGLLKRDRDSTTNLKLKLKRDRYQKIKNSDQNPKILLNQIGKLVESCLTAHSINANIPYPSLC